MSEMIGSADLWTRIKRQRAAEMYAIQEASIGDALVLANRLASTMSDQVVAIRAEMPDDRIIWSVESSGSLPPARALDIEWMLRSVGPCTEPGATRWIQANGPQRMPLRVATEDYPAPDDEDNTDLLAEFLFTDHAALQEIVLNPGPTFSTEMVRAAARHAAASPCEGHGTSATLVSAILMSRTLRALDSASEGYLLTLRYDHAIGVDVGALIRMNIAGYRSTDDPTQHELLIDAANHELDSTGIWTAFFEKLDQPEHQWCVLSGVIEREYPTPRADPASAS